MKTYPSWRYHKNLGSKIVADEAEDKGLGEGWVDTPAKFLDAEELSKLPESELVEMNKDSGLKESTLKRRTKKQLAQMIVEKK
jgi:hypothetical protein